MSKADDIFWKEFGVILLLLFAFSVTMFIIARSIGAATLERMHTSPRQVAMRIEPVGQVRVGDPAQQSEAALGGSETGVASAPVASASAATAASVATVASADAAPGESVYFGLCHACHAAGLVGAPKPDDTAAWQERLEKGLDEMVAIAIKGQGGMPPRGGNPKLSDDEIRQAVEYMLAQAGLETG